jgi:predicted phage tail protein
MVILAAGMFGTLLYAAALVSSTFMAVGLVLGALGFGGLALVAMLGEVKP